MIVCWVLFSLMCLVGGGGAIGHWHYQGQLDSLADKKIEIGYQNWIDGIDPPYVTDELVTAPDVLTNLRQLKAIAELDRRWHKSQSSWSTLGFVGAGGATFIFLWNLICHIGHWIWMGRKAE